MIKISTITKLQNLTQLKSHNPNKPRISKKTRKIIKSWEIEKSHKKEMIE